MDMKEKYPLLASADPLSCVAGKLLRSARIVLGIYRKHLKKHDLTVSQLSILLILGRRLRMPQADLGRRLHLDRSTITRDLKRLLGKGYLRREGPVNRLDIEITESGAAYLQTIIPDWQKAVAESQEVLGEGGVHALDVVLSKFSDG